MGKKLMDANTGEVVEEPDFVKVYMQRLMVVKGLTARQHEVFNFLVSNMNFNNEVSYTLRAKRNFISEAGMSNASFNNSIKPLIAADLIKREAKGDYLINKKYVVRASWDKVQSIRWEATFTNGESVDLITAQTGED